MSASSRSLLRIFAFIWRYWRQYPFQLACLISGVLLAMSLEVQIPAATAQLVQDFQAALVASADPNRSADPNGSGDQNTQIEAAYDAAMGSLVVLVLFFAGVTLVNQSYIRLWIYFAANVMQRLVNDGFDKAQAFSHQWHSNAFAGATVRKITRGMWAYDDIADQIMIELGPAIALLIGLSFVMFMRDVFLGLYFTLTIAIFLLVSVLMALKYVAPQHEISNDADTAVNGALSDAITCNQVVKAFGRESFESKRVASTTAHWRVSARKAWLRSMDAGLVQSILLILLLTGLLYLVLQNAKTQAIAFDDMVFVITSYFLVNGHLRNIGSQVRELQGGLNEINDLVLISETPLQINDQPQAKAINIPQGNIEFRQVRFHYQGVQNSVFENLNLNIKANEKIALVGESGAGKSTFVKLLQRFYDLNDGEILIDQENIAKVKQISLRREIALVPQDPILFHRSLRENIAYARPEATLEEVIAAAKKAHADEFINRLELGYDTLVGERGIKLSGGERQRIAIARAILSKAKIIILDEATSSLDTITEYHIQQAIDEVIKNRTAIIIAHRLSTIRKVDRIIVFQHGKIVEQGCHDQLVCAQNGVYRALYAMQEFEQ